MKGSAHDVSGLFHFRCVREAGILRFEPFTSQLDFDVRRQFEGAMPMKRVVRLAAALASVAALAVSRSAVPQRVCRQWSARQFQAADIAPIEIEKGEGKHDDIADMQLPSPTT